MAVTSLQDLPPADGDRDWDGGAAEKMDDAAPWESPAGCRRPRCSSRAHSC